MKFKKLVPLLVLGYLYVNFGIFGAFAKGKLGNVSTYRVEKDSKVEMKEMVGNKCENNCKITSKSVGNKKNESSKKTSFVTGKKAEISVQKKVIQKSSAKKSVEKEEFRYLKGNLKQKIDGVIDNYVARLSRLPVKVKEKKVEIIKFKIKLLKSRIEKLQNFEKKEILKEILNYILIKIQSN